MRSTAKGFFLVTLILSCFVIIPLAWTIPMYIRYGKAVNDKQPHIALGVCSIIFTGIFGVVAGILILCDPKGKK
ncbi:MAG: hypothetical protein LBQ45_02625 [Mycoplasmataceae bacterium]|nr:hypothetical protein [Mycoplasmataceae bacterium]